MWGSLAVANISTASALNMPAGNWYLKLHGGAGWYSEGRDQTLNYGQGDFDRFTNKGGDREIVLLYGLGGGYSFDMSNQGRMDVGIGWYGDCEHEYKGYIDQYAKTSLRDFEYKYKVQTQRVVLEGSWSFPFYQQLEGFVTGGIGMRWNKFSNYSTNKLDPKEESPKPQFNKNTNSAFAWQLGTGVSWAFTPQWRASVFYLYANNGKAEASSNAPFSNKYETDDITSHDLMFSLNYQF